MVPICVICFGLFCIWGQIPNISPRGLIFGGAYYRRDFCVSNLRGLYSEGLIFGILRLCKNYGTNIHNRHAVVLTRISHAKFPIQLWTAYSGLYSICWFLYWVMEIVRSCVFVGNYLYPLQKAHYTIALSFTYESLAGLVNRGYELHILPYLSW